MQAVASLRNDARDRLRALEEEQATLDAAYAACDDRDRDSLDNVMDAIDKKAAELDAIDENWSADFYDQDPLFPPLRRGLVDLDDRVA